MVGERRAAFRDRPSHLNRGYLAVCSAARFPAIWEVKPTKINLSLLAGLQESGDEMATVYGYARVSSRDQNLNRQLDALGAYGVGSANIYADHASGKDFDRPRYRELLHVLGDGDVLVVLSIDRLGRNYSEILEEWRRITKELGVAIVVLDMPLLDTRARASGAPDVTNTLIADIVLQLLSYVAQVERENIHRRQAEGIAAARARGVRFGRPRKPCPPQFELVRDSYEAGDITRSQAAECLGVCVGTFDRWMREAG